MGRTRYLVAAIPLLSAWTLLAVILAGCCFDLAARLFADTAHLLSGLRASQAVYWRATESAACSLSKFIAKTRALRSVTIPARQ
ncbi:hypothetical protein ACB376_08125 [Klebsiella electrica]